MGKSPANFRDLTGRVFGRLTVVARAENIGNWQSRWTCRCSCDGKLVIVRAACITNGGTQSCGCLRQTHGGSGTREYRIWLAMKMRCADQSQDNYGGRGISVCERWRDSFENFLADMGKCPSPDHSIDRFPDNDGNYEPGNCRWATAIEQMGNTRKNRMLTYKGETKHASEWARLIGMKVGTMMARLRKGWSDEKIIEMPVKHLTWHFGRRHE
jgi:hypothetical protein